MVREDPANTQPEFPNAVYRFLPEDTPDYKYVGEPVVATDADTGDVLTYTLDGKDEDSFYIANSNIATDDTDTDNVDDQALAGQIRVKVLTDLDHETDPSYVVEVEATDSTSNDPDAFANTDVDIYVTDVDEKPDLWVMENGNRVRGEFEVDYVENDDSPVLTLMANDPEGVRDIVWSLLTMDEAGTPVQNLGLADPAEADDVVAADSADNAEFSISSSGVLSFKNPPSFEDESVGQDDVYKVVVQASDGGTTDDTLADGTTPLPRGNLNWLKVAVTVTDEEEDGTISLTPTDVPEVDGANVVLLQPQVDIGITADLTDPDGETIITGWKWERRQRQSAQWQTIAGETTATYTPKDEADTNNPSPPAGETNRIDVGDTLRVTATYTDPSGTAEKTAERIIENPVLGALEDNTVPAFLSATANRSVSENAPAGTAVGAPVSATDPDFETTAERNSRKVTYWLPVDENTDNSLFSIDSMSGQIKVMTPQNFEKPMGGTDNTTTYEVTVRATDSSAKNSAVLRVSIELVDEDEAPTIDLVTEVVTGLNETALPVISHAGGKAIEFAENGEGKVVTFTVSDQDGGTPTLRLIGTDASRFDIEDVAVPDNEDVAVPDNNGARVAGNLVFKGSPDFENPKDGRPVDNIYEVTLEAQDGRNTTTLDVTVKVTNVEEPGEVALAYQQPLIGRVLTATVTDSDGGFSPSSGAPRTDVTGVTWQWYRTAGTYAPLANECVGNDVNNAALNYVPIEGATSATYKPVAADEERCLQAEAEYLDRTFIYQHAPFDEYVHADPAGDPAVEPTRWGFQKSAMVASGVTRIDPNNVPPAFDGPATRFVPENTPAHRYVDIPVTAMDTDDLVYSLGGADEKLFYIAANATQDVATTDDRNEMADAGQIWVGPLTDLDHELVPERSVRVTAADTYNATGSTSVTITVVDVDEAPEIFEAGLTISGETSINYAENGTGAVATYTVVGPDAATARLTLTGDDAGDFSLSGGDLSFRSSPDYEAPADADGDNVYELTLEANDGTYTASRTLSVAVTNVDELGALAGDANLSYAEDRTDAVGTYEVTGGDGSAISWSREGADAGQFTLTGTGMSRTLMFSSAPDFEAPADADGDNEYMVTVKAEAGGEMAMQEVTVMVTNMEEAGTVTLDPARPSVDTEITATLEDMDIVETVSWQWAEHAATDDGSMPAEDSADWMDITGETDASYTPDADDADMWLRATATYTDGFDPGNTNTAMAVSTSAVTQLAVNGPDDVDYDENGTSAVGTYVASGADSVQWSLSGDDDGAFDILGGVLTFSASPNYEARADADMDNVYMVTVVASDGTAMDSRDVAVTVIDVDEGGSVTGVARVRDGWHGIDRNPVRP